MKYLIFSDTHLTHEFDEELFRTLINVISEVDRVIINGDFWDGLTTAFDIFLQSQWSKLFPLLLEKQANYIYGNHDKRELCDKRVELFSVSQNESLDITLGKLHLFITHGHTIVPSLEDLYPYLFRNKLSYFAGHYLHRFMATYGNGILNLRFKQQNAKMRVYQKRVLGPETYLVAGHSHFQELLLEKKYVNSGAITGRKFQYTIIDTSASTLENFSVPIK